eukprot:GHVS01073631.1.p4 GENE.GHVS01073631.1~~GHVS01073631.1.p4  ORF type:complete len:100 (+),score=6.25 GHVS01073631.1:494-793(+)
MVRMHLARPRLFRQNCQIGFQGSVNEPLCCIEFKDGFSWLPDEDVVTAPWCFPSRNGTEQRQQPDEPPALVVTITVEPLAQWLLMISCCVQNRTCVLKS